jgi:hypothetical protein
MNRNNIYNNPSNTIYQPDKLYVNPPLNINKPVPQISESYINEFKKEHKQPFLNEKSNQYPSHTNYSNNTLSKNFTNNTFGSGYLSSNEFEKPKTIFDNLAPVLMNKEVSEYPIIIDSGDRDYQIYNNPFNFRVILNGINGLKTPFLPRDFENIKFVKLVNCALPRYYRLKKINSSFNNDITSNTTSYLNDTWNVNIGNVYSISYLNDILNNFQNSTQTINGNVVTYLTLNIEGYLTANINGTIQSFYTTNFQRTYLLDTNYITGNFKITNYELDYIVNGNIDYVYIYNTNLTNNSTYYVTEDIDYDIFKERYILLHMSEIKNMNENATNDNMRRSFAVLYPNKINRSYVYLFTDGIDKFFKNSDLQNLKNITLYFEDSTGNMLENPFLNLTMNNINRKAPINLDKNTKILNIDYTAPDKYIRHPFYKNNQITILLKVGIYENDIDKNLFSYNK